MIAKGTLKSTFFSGRHSNFTIRNSISLKDKLTKERRSWNMSRTAIVLPLLFLIVQVTIAQDRPPIGIIDFYGLRTVPQARVREMLALKEGDAVPANQSELEQQLAAI